MNQISYLKASLSKKSICELELYISAWVNFKCIRSGHKNKKLKNIYSHVIHIKFKNMQKHSCITVRKNKGIVEQSI